jgi:glycosyltransferase involved in cell wall biosynthesis
MQSRLGIGIITYNRKDQLRETIRAVRNHTRHADTDLVVADDGSTDGTLAMLREEDVGVVTGVNMGVAWNKNRALYLLAQIRRCDVVILLEDDTVPDTPAWEEAWIAAARRWGHVNYAGSWLQHHFVRGTGSADDPILSTQATAQCTAFTRDVLDWGGYLDPAFRGYGHAHVEHTRRLIRLGYGGTGSMIDGQEQVLFALIGSGLTVRDQPNHYDQRQSELNQHIATQAMMNPNHRSPWRDLPELKQFRSEIDRAVQTHAGGFALRGPPPPRRRGLLAWLFRRNTA